jgi:hypothetical protein
MASCDRYVVSSTADDHFLAPSVFSVFIYCSYITKVWPIVTCTVDMIKGNAFFNNNGGPDNLSVCPRVISTNLLNNFGLYERFWVIFGIRKVHSKMC